VALAQRQLDLWLLAYRGGDAKPCVRCIPNAYGEVAAAGLDSTRAPPHEAITASAGHVLLRVRPVGA
jgi:hypothetical protein